MDQQAHMQQEQEQYDAAVNAAAQIADLTATFLHKRVKATQAGMLSKAHKKKYRNQTGIVTDIIAGQVCGLRIAWEDGTESQSLPYMVELVTA